MLTYEYCGKFGCVIETNNAIYIFDYTEGTLPSRYLISNKPKWMIVSRNNHEHYSESIHSYKIPTIYSYDFQSEKINKEILMEPGDSVHLGYATIHAHPTTRRGLCFSVVERKNRFYYGGDFNLWHWPNMFSEQQVVEEFHRFHRCLKSIKLKGPYDLAAMVTSSIMTVDSYRGAREFIQMIEPNVFAPLDIDDDARLETFALWVKSQQNTRLIEDLGKNKKNIIK